MDGADQVRRPASGSWFRRPRLGTGAGSDRASQRSRATRNIGTSSSSRPSNFWPFLNTTPSSIGGGGGSTINNLFGSSHGRRRTDTGTGTRSYSRPLSTVTFFEKDMIPDYIVNFLRGETPETLARRREEEEQLRLRQQEDEMNGSGRGNEGPGGGRPALHTRTVSKMSLMDKMLNQHGERETKRNTFARKFLTGWRGGIALNIALATLILAASITCFVIAVTRDNGAGGKSLGGELSLMTSTSCRAVQVSNIGIRVAVNVLGVVLIAGANYVFQVLCSPTRSEADAAHAKRDWVDIAVPSVRNLRRIGWVRAALAVIVVVLAVGTQVMYNAITVTTKTTRSSTISPSHLIDSSADSDCTLILNRTLLGVTAILNLTFAVALSLSLAHASTSSASSPLLVTLGDAIASFLTQIDMTTQGACLLTKEDVKNGRWEQEKPTAWTGRRHRWMMTASRTRWLVWLVSWLVPTGLAAGGLAITVIDKTKDEPSPFSSFTDADIAYRFPGRQPPLAALAIIVSLPQLLVGTLYLTTNSLLTTFFASRELCQFAIPAWAATLRVSSGQPAGEQTTSLYLTLPRPYSWLLFLVFAGTGLMLSQALSLRTLQDQLGDSTSAVALNGLPLVVLLGLLGLMGILVLGLSLRHAGPTPRADDEDADLRGVCGDGDGGSERSIAEHVKSNPLAFRGGSCSAVLSARCHRMPSEGGDAALHALVWGVAYEGTGLAAGHATFSSRQVGVMRVGRMYA